ncbi:MAG: tetratricopeptide repeat protein [Pirellulales bacterium]
MTNIAETLQSGLEHHRAGRLRDAEMLYRSVLKQHPRNASAGHLLGLIAYQAGRSEEAVELLSTAARIEPYNAAFQADLGEILRVLGKTPEAIAACSRAVAIDPSMADVHHCLGLLHEAQEDRPRAIECYREAARLDAAHAAAHANLGLALRAEGHLSEANEALTKAVQLAPDNADHYLGLGVCLYDQGQLLDAIACYQKTLRLAPGNVKAQYNCALARLALGDLANGWREFETRHAFESLVRRKYALPMWYGDTAQTGALLVHAEQGFGDAIQFVRYAALLSERGMHVVVDVHEELVTLLTASGFRHVVADGSVPPECTSQVPLLSLPRVLGTTLETIPAQVPYLAAEPERVAAWRKRLEPHRGLRVGINWQGRPTHYNDRVRSLQLAQLAPLAAIAGVQLISLQQGVGTEQLAEFAGRWPLLDLSQEIRDFHDTAAVIRNLDLVISCDSAPAHLAGALGVPTWVALSVGSDWRWLQNRTDTPWYPTMRLYRQPTLGVWDDVVSRMAGDVAALAAARRA